MKSEKETLSIVGFGDLGKQYLSFLKSDGNEICLFDDFITENLEYKVMSFDSYLNVEFSNSSFYIAIGYNHLELKSSLIDELLIKNRSCPHYIHSTCFIHPSAKINQASFLYPMCNIGQNVTIGKGVVLNNGVIVSHDSEISDCSYLSPGVVVSGNVKIGKCTFIGSGTIISNGISIGNNVRIGVGTVVTKDIPDNSNVIGNPMRFLDKKISL